jgi:uncharacterized protein YigA (DUF484 family)
VSNQETTTPESEKVVQSIGVQGVADYLRRHPDFFEDKPSLLADLRIPHSTGSAVSLVERQVAVLREANAGLQDQLEGLIQVARENDKLNDLLHKLTLRLVACHNLTDLLSLIDTRLRRDFSADLSTVCLLSSPKDVVLATRPEFVRDADAFCGLFQRLLSVGKPYCGQLKTEQLEALFGEQAGEVMSTALLPLNQLTSGGQGKLGLIAIGSFQRNRFHSGADTAFLERMSEIVAATLQGYLQDD